MLTAWMTAIAGVIALGVLLEILLSEGQTGKYVKGAFSLLVIFVVVSPLPSVIRALKNWEPTYSDLAPDYGFVDETAAEWAKECALRVEDALKDAGYDADAEIVIKEGSVSEIDEINIVLDLSVLPEGEWNRHISSAEKTVRELSFAAGCAVHVTAAGGVKSGSA